MAQFINARFEMFKLQNQKNGYFDLKFEIEGKIIYAHKFMLSTASEVLKAMISDIWNNGEFIKIETYSYTDFYELLTFIYSGECKLNDENIFTMVDLSEFYHVESLQQKCDEYLSKKEYTSETILMFFEKLVNYSLPLFEKTLLKCIIENLFNLDGSERFMELSKETIKRILSFEDRFVSEEELFQKVYEWAENKAIKKRDESNVENFNMNDAIKDEITEFLPYIYFKKMNLKFLHKFVVKRGFLFTYAELSDILDNSKSEFKVKVTNAFGKSIYCLLPRDSDVIENLRSLKNCLPTNNTHHWVYWEKCFTKPSTPSLLKNRDGVKWYLALFYHGQICVIRHAYTGSSQYLIAEMTTESDNFEITENCKIEIE